jgi:hypothetical protein
MLKKEIIWRELLYQTIEKKSFKFTQKALAQKFKFSLSTVFNALKIPRAIGAVEAGGKGLKIRDLEKLITLWATVRNLSKDIIYQTNSNKTALKTEKSMPNGIIWTAYSGFRLKYPNEPMPADYDKIYVYADEIIIKEIKKRFPPNKKESNLFILKPDAYLKNYGKIAPIAQMLADLWNLKDWYANEFYQTLLAKIQH